MRLLLLLSVVSSVALAQFVPWQARTLSIPSTRAADPAIVTGGGVAMLVGTDPSQVGLYLYGLDGTSAGSVLTGAARSVDALGDVVVSTAYVLQELQVYRAVGNTLQPALDATHNVPTPTAVALGPGADGGLIAWVDDSLPALRQIALTPTDDGGFSAALLGSVPLPESSGGVAVDPTTGDVYVSQPNRGVLAIESGVPRFVVSIDAGQLGPVVGGVDVYPLAVGGSLLFTTSPATNEVVVHRLTPAGFATWLGAFRVAATVDGGTAVQLPGHLDVYPGALPGYPQGALVLHDGVLSNYALARLDDVAAAFTPPLPLGAAGGGAGGGGGSTGGGAGGGGGSSALPTPDGGTGSTRPPPSSEPMPTGCGCTAVPVVALPTLLLLWWIRRSRS
jgi:hypothetical protein